MTQRRRNPRNRRNGHETTTARRRVRAPPDTTTARQVNIPGVGEVPAGLAVIGAVGLAALALSRSGDDDGSADMSAAALSPRSDESYTDWTARCRQDGKSMSECAAKWRDR